MVTKNSIRKSLQKNRKLLSEYNVLRVGLFGSYVRGEASEDSDIDLLVETDKGMDLIAMVDLELKLSEVFGKKVDLVSTNGMNKHIKPFILKEVEFVEGI